LSEEDRTSHQGLTVQVTIGLQLHRSERKKSAVYLFFLDLFFVTFFCLDTKESKLESKQIWMKTMRAIVTR